MIHVERGDAPDDFVRYAADYWEEFMGKSPRRDWFSSMGNHVKSACYTGMSKIGQPAVF